MLHKIQPKYFHFIKKEKVSEAIEKKYKTFKHINRIFIGFNSFLVKIKFINWFNITCKWFFHLGSVRKRRLQKLKFTTASKWVYTKS